MCMVSKEKFGIFNMLDIYAQNVDTLNAFCVIDYIVYSLLSHNEIGELYADMLFRDNQKLCELFERERGELHG